MNKLSLIAAGAVLLLGGAAAAHADTYALLMGINDYPDVVDANGKPMKDDKGEIISCDLKGAVNDIKTYNDVLVNKFGIHPDHIKMVLDKDAGEKGFVDGMTWLIDSAKPGDQIIFCYSGHGGQIEDKTEADGTQEVIVLADEKLVPGNLFGELAKGFVKSGVNASFVFDSCFSGGMSRNIFSYDGKPGTTRKKFLDGNLTKKMTSVPAATLTEVKMLQKKAPTQSEAEYAFIFAGSEDQTTSDLEFKDPATPSRGLFSLLFGAVLQDDPDVSLADAIKEIADILKEKGFDQKPGFEFSNPDRGKKPLLIKQ
ncbi:hypothetical protein BH11ARM1_BH11ARM1_03590 [soil metagenome]